MVSGGPERPKTTPKTKPKKEKQMEIRKK